MPSFRELFGKTPDEASEAPGRVNLIGEHTDYNGGYVLPAAIPQRTSVELARRRDSVARVWSAQFARDGIQEYSLGSEVRQEHWTDYVKAMTWVLAGYGLSAGFDARIDSSIPPGSGLSSSAALEVSLGRALRAAYALRLDDVELAKAARRAENEFVGAPVGIMDQMACSLATTDAALFLDTRSLEYRRIPLPAESALAVIDSGISHSHAGGEYATRRRECAEAARRLGVSELRDVVDPARASELPAPLDRRARHVITENRRVLEAVEALHAGDLVALGRLFYESHASLRDDFEVSLPAIDVLVDIASSVQGTYGARLTGGGFGGCVVVLCDRAEAYAAATQIVADYERKTGRKGRMLLPT